MSRQDDKLREAIHELVAKFFNEQSNKSSLITVTRVALTEKARKAVIFITVLPEEKETEALSFGRRLRTEIRGKILKELDIAHPPFVEVEIDIGEKNRVRIEEISKKSKEA